MSFNQSLPDELYRKILLLQEHLRHEKKQQTIREVLNSFPFELIDGMDILIFEKRSYKDYKEVIEESIKEFLHMNQVDKI